MGLKAINPTTRELIREYPEMDEVAVGSILRAASHAFEDWKRHSVQDRAALVKGIGDVLRSRVEDLAELMALEMGKPIREGRAEVEKCAWVCDYYSENGPGFLKDQQIETDAAKSFVTFQPLGLVLAVMPWNFPFWQVFRFLAPSLIAGNVGVLKHSSNVPGCALAIEEVVQGAGLPEDVFRTLLIGSSKVASVIQNPLVKAVTLTGSTPAGRDVARVAGQSLKKSVLELGGSDPYLILEDADLAVAVPNCVTGRLINSGQSCIAAKRFVVVEAIRGEFEQRFVDGMAAAVMGNPLEDGITVGPQARHDLRDELHQQVTTSVEKGARCLLGGEVPAGPGAFYPATVLTDVSPGMPAYEEELFGPVASIIPVEDEEGAIRVANDTPFGLGAAVFTRDLARGQRIASEELEAGCCFVNAFVRSDPRLPFGGIKESGYGRELSDFGIREFVNVKTVYLA